MPYSLNASTDSCYEGTTCLINKLGICDEKILAETEAAYTLAKASYLELHPLSGQYDFAHYCAIHKFLFGDLYEWAGEVRTVDLSKKGTSFAAAAEIKQCANACFARAAEINYAALSRGELVEEIADFYSTLNMIHPFREGNGRAQRVYFAQWIRHIGFDIDFGEIDPDIFMIATIHAAQGMKDDLIALFDKALIEPQQTNDFQQTML